MALRKEPITELQKPSLMRVSSLFSSVNIVVADADHKIANLIKNILNTLGCHHIYVVHDGQSVIQLMKEETIDMVITDWTMKTIGGIDLAIYLRQSLDSPNRMVPIIMLTARNERSDIQQARDAGVSEYLVKPFSAKTLLERVYSIVEEPRSFIMCKSFIGPDRRRISSLTLPPDPDENHAFFERRPPAVVNKDSLKQVILDDTPRMIMPDYSLKKKVGFNVPAELLINPLTLAKTDEEIAKVHNDFIASIMKDIEAMQSAYHILITAPDHATELMNKIKESAHTVRGRSGTFGYMRATEVAQQLYNFCHRHYDKGNKYHLIILEKHIQTLAVIFAHKIIGDGGQIGSELLKDLARLVNKYHMRKH